MYNQRMLARKALITDAANVKMPISNGMSWPLSVKWVPGKVT
jgi:hypothetical protein